MEQTLYTVTMKDDSVVIGVYSTMRYAYNAALWFGLNRDMVLVNVAPSMVDTRLDFKSDSGLVSLYIDECILDDMHTFPPCRYAMKEEE